MEISDFWCTKSLLLLHTFIQGMTGFWRRGSQKALKQLDRQPNIRHRGRSFNRRVNKLQGRPPTLGDCQILTSPEGLRDSLWLKRISDPRGDNRRMANLAATVFGLFLAFKFWVKTCKSQLKAKSRPNATSKSKRPEYIPSQVRVNKVQVSIQYGGPVIPREM